MDKPKELETIDLEALRKICKEYIDFIDNDEEYHEDNDYEYYLYEVSLEAVFGENIWEFINNRHQ